MECVHLVWCVLDHALQWRGAAHLQERVSMELQWLRVVRHAAAVPQQLLAALSYAVSISVSVRGPRTNASCEEWVCEEKKQHASIDVCMYRALCRCHAVD